MTKALILHAGFHKTGTTALQACFFNNYDELKRVGVLFPKTGITFIKDSPREGACSGCDNLLRMASVRSKSLLERLMSEGVNSVQTVLLSMENLFHPFKSHKYFHQDLTDLLSVLPAFEKKILALTVKKPEKMFRSLYSELVTGGNALYEKTYTTFFNQLYKKKNEYRKKLEVAEELGFEIKFILCTDDVIDCFIEFMIQANLINRMPIFNRDSHRAYRSPSLEHEALIRVVNNLGLSRPRNRTISKKILGLPNEFFYKAGIEFREINFDAELLKKHYAFINDLMHDYGLCLKPENVSGGQVRDIITSPGSSEDILARLGLGDQIKRKRRPYLANMTKAVSKKILLTGNLYARRVGFWKLAPERLKDLVLSLLLK